MKLTKVLVIAAMAATLAGCGIPYQSSETIYSGPINPWPVNGIIVHDGGWHYHHHHHWHGYNGGGSSSGIIIHNGNGGNTGGGGIHVNGGGSNGGNIAIPKASGGIVVN